MPETNDMDLVRAYACDHSEPAFSELVHRHIHLVYSVALRCTRNPEDAQDVTQAVFIILAKKAVRLHERTVLTGWLYETTRFTAARLWRAQARRHAREQEACMESTLNTAETDGVWCLLAPQLEEAMSGLGERDRTLLALRFYENKSGAEAAALLGIHEQAAHKRTARAVERLRTFFSKRGLTLSVVAITSAISAHSVQAAPEALAKAVTAIAVSKGVVAGSSTLTLVKGVLKLMAWTKAKTAIVIGAGILLATGTATITFRQIQEHKKYSWEVPKADFGLFYKTPAQVRIVQTKFSENGGWCCDEGRGAMGIAQPVEKIVHVGYQKDSLRTVIECELPPGRYDFFAKLVDGMKTDKGWTTALQREIARKFGITGRLETRETDVLILKPGVTGAQGFKPSHQMPNGRAVGFRPGNYSFFEQSVSTMTSLLEQRFKIPIVDATGLAGEYDFSIQWSEPDPKQPNLDGLKQALHDQLGLELVPDRRPIEMLVVEKVK